LIVQLFGESFQLGGGRNQHYLRFERDDAFDARVNCVANFRDLLVNNAPVLTVAVGMTLVILTGQVDISIGSQFAVCSVAAGILAKTGLALPIVLLLVFQSH